MIDYQDLTPFAFPACAGMDHTRASGGSPGGGVPRRRGDGPVMMFPSYSPTTCSPQARDGRWTTIEKEEGRHPHIVVFPAGAGMNRSCFRRSTFGTSVPRRRRDGPYREDIISMMSMRSPQVRG